MPRQNLTSSLQTNARGKALLGGFASEVASFKSAAKNQEAKAADAATKASRGTFQSQLSGRPTAPARFGRPTTTGSFASLLNWIPNHESNRIVFATDNIAPDAPYFLIQEIGTGQKAKILNPPGEIEVRSQVGRTISARLLWANGPGDAGVAAQSGIRSQQLYLASDLSGTPDTRKVRGRKVRIRREIKGKHFLRDGGVIGFRTLADGLDADARRIFQ